MTIGQRVHPSWPDARWSRQSIGQHASPIYCRPSRAGLAVSERSGWRGLAGSLICGRLPTATETDSGLPAPAARPRRSPTTSAYCPHRTPIRASPTRPRPWFEHLLDEGTCSGLRRATYRRSAATGEIRERRNQPRDPATRSRAPGHQTQRAGSARSRNSRSRRIGRGVQCLVCFHSAEEPSTRLRSTHPRGSHLSESDRPVSSAPLDTADGGQSDLVAVIDGSSSRRIDEWSNRQSEKPVFNVEEAYLVARFFNKDCRLLTPAQVVAASPSHCVTLGTRMFMRPTSCPGTYRGPATVIPAGRSNSMMDATDLQYAGSHLWPGRRPPRNDQRH